MFELCLFLKGNYKCTHLYPVVHLNMYTNCFNCFLSDLLKKNSIHFSCETDPHVLGTLLFQSNNHFIFLSRHFIQNLSYSTHLGWDVMSRGMHGLETKIWGIGVWSHWLRYWSHTNVSSLVIYGLMSGGFLTLSVMCNKLKPSLSRGHSYLMRL